MTAGVREKVVFVPVEEIGDESLFPVIWLKPAPPGIEIVAPFTLQVAGTVPVAVIEPLVAA